MKEKKLIDEEYIIEKSMVRGTTTQTIYHSGIIIINSKKLKGLIGKKARVIIKIKKK